MKSIMLRCAAGMAAGLLFSASAFGSWAVAGGNSGETNAFPCVGQIGHDDGAGGSTFDCSGTVVGNGMFVLTAAHCLSGINDPQNARFRLGNTTYFGQQIMRHPTADIAIIKLGTMLSDTYPVACPPTLTGQQFCGVGFGAGSSNGGTATATWDLPYGTKRVFYNVIDGLSPDGGLLNEPAWQYTLNIPGGIAGEGLHGPGDSGGPMLANINGTLSVVGVLSYGRNVNGQFLPRPGAQAGGPGIDEWTKTRVPAPGGAGVLMGTVLVLARRRR